MDPIIAEGEFTSLDGHPQPEHIYNMIVMAPIMSFMSTIMKKSPAWDLISIPLISPIIYSHNI